MIYENNTKEAVLAMEEHRLGHYGEDEYIGEYCPICDEYDPEYFYVNLDNECVGCSECITCTSSIKK